ncbi:MAG: hypothetical protein Q9M09_02480 [Mariprofundaceae bacterium]|nr:hypothetical protein [Mariprofundaceae bacterium]
MNRRDDCVEPLFATDALSEVAYPWIRSTDKASVADKGASKGATILVNNFGRLFIASCLR